MADVSTSTGTIFPRLVLREMIWRGATTIRIPFTDGLNIIHGRTQTERTIILRLIRYAMGGSHDRIDSTILRSSEKVELTFTANEERLKAIRSCQHPSAQIELIHSSGKTLMTPSEMSRMFLQKLGLPFVYLPTKKPDGTIGETLLSFNDLSRAFVVDRDISYSGIMANAYERNASETIKIMMGLTTSEIAKRENEIRSLETQLANLHSTITSVKDFLRSLDVPTSNDIQSRRDQLIQKREQLWQGDNEIRNAARYKLNSVTLASSESNMAQTTYQGMRDELLRQRAMLDAQQRQLRNVSHQLREKQDLRALITGEIDKIDRHLVANYVVSTYTFTMCPRCMQGVTDTMVLREQDKGLCMLCGRPLQEHRTDTEVEAWGKALRDPEQARNEVDSLISDYAKQEQELSDSVLNLQNRVSSIEKQLESETAQYVSPFVEQMRLIESQKLEVEKALSHLDYQLRQRELAERYEEVDLPEAEKRRDETLKLLEELRVKVGRPEDHYNAFLAHFKYFLKGVNMDQSISNITWDEKTQLPKINGQPPVVMVGFNMVLIVLAFHYALLAMSVTEPKVKTLHPKLLLIDEPEQQKMGKERLQSVLQLFADLALQNADSTQIIIATETKDIPVQLLGSTHAI